MGKYISKLDPNIEVEAKQLTDDNAVRLSVWLDSQGVSNTVYLNNPDLGVGDLRCSPGRWIIVIPNKGYVTLTDEAFQRSLTEVK